MNETKLSFTFTEEDMKILAKLKAQLAVTMGKVSNIVAIRSALRSAVREGK